MDHGGHVTHYAHSNLVRGTTTWRNPDGTIPLEKVRDFNTLQEHNELIVKNINDLVGQDDVLIHLGDWSFGGFEKIELFRKRIICQEVHIIMGNHDQHIIANTNGYQSLFESVSTYNEMEIGKTKIILMHYPISSWNGMHKGSIHLHGHVHTRPGNTIYGRRMDIGLDGHPNFSPYPLLECVDLLKDREVEYELRDLDHHKRKK